MANLNGFDANQVDPQQPMGPIPAGDYIATITESEMKQTKSGTGEYLELIFQIHEGPMQGRRVYDRLNIKNQNQQAQEIARSQLSAICHAVNVLRPNDSIELHNIPLLITVKLVPRNDKPGEQSNEISGYAKKPQMATGQSQATPPPAQNQQHTQGFAPPQNSNDVPPFMNPNQQQ